MTGRKVFIYPVQSEDNSNTCSLPWPARPGSRRGEREGRSWEEVPRVIWRLHRSREGREGAGDDDKGKERCSLKVM